MILLRLPLTLPTSANQVWGIVADQESLAVAEKLVSLPTEADMSNGGMKMLATYVAFTPLVVK